MIEFVFLMMRRPTRSTRTGTLLPDTTLCRSAKAEDREETAIAEGRCHFPRMRPEPHALLLGLGLGKIGYAAVSAERAYQDRDGDQQGTAEREAAIAVGVELTQRIFGRHFEDHGQGDRAEAIGPDVTEQIAQRKQPGPLVIIVR